MLKKLLYLLVLSACSSAAFSQSTSASLTGLVDDPAKALIPGATITAINTQTGEKASTTTNKEGQYVLPGLNPGTYRIEVDKQGFKGIIEAGLTLHVQDAVQINFHMAVGSSSESVTVNASQININTTDGTVSTVIDQSYIANMPLNGRSFQDLILLTPGVVTNSPQSTSAIGATGEFSVNGQRTEENYYTVDGVSANVGAGTSGNMSVGAGASGSLGASTALGTTQGLANVDSLQEFRVQSSSYSAEYGRNPGGQFAFETKSGSKQIHGSAFDYLRNGYFDAPDWFNDYFGVPYPSIHQNDFGGTVGGPVRIPGLYHRKDSTFFFTSYEGLRLLSPQAAAVSYVPDMTLKSNAPASVLAPLNAFPTPNGPDLGNGVAEYIGSWSNPSAIDSTSIRLDHSLNDNTNLFFRFSETDSNATSRPVLGNSGTPSDPETTSFTMRTYTFGENGALGKGMANEFRLNRSTNDVVDLYELDAFAGATPVNLTQASGLDPGSELIFQMQLGDISQYTSDLDTGKQPSSQAQWNVVDSVNVVLGHHALKFGVDFRRLTPTIQFAPQLGLWYFGSVSSVLANETDFSGIASQLSYYPLYTNFSAFAQDEWRASRRLNLSLGMRWDVNPPPGATQGEKPWTIVGANDPATATLAPYGTPLWHTTWFNFAPRVGAAYIVRNSPKWEMVVRGGGGVFFDSGNQDGSLNAGLGPGSSAAAFSSGPYPTLPPAPIIVQPTPPYTGLSGQFNVYGYDPHLQLPYTLQWNASIQQELGASQSLTVSYVGSHASRLIEANTYGSPNNPSIPFYTYVENGLTSDYNSLQVQFQRRLSAGLTALASYTWSHCEDDGSSNLSFGYQHGNCSMDVRQNIAAAFSYDVPSVGHEAAMRSVLGHWGLDNRFTARTGFPVTLTGPVLSYPDFKQYDAGLNIVPGQPFYLYGANCTSTLLGLGDLSTGQTCPGGRAINPNAFTEDTTALGNAPRNFARGFGALQLDTAVRREFPIGERLKLQFRAEAFNVLNHPNFGNINGIFGQSTFGQATATLANSLGVLSPLYQMGGARSMQFSLRLGF